MRPAKRTPWKRRPSAARRDRRTTISCMMRLWPSRLMLVVGRPSPCRRCSPLVPSRAPLVVLDEAMGRPAPVGEDEEGDLLALEELFHHDFDPRSRTSSPHDRVDRGLRSLFLDHQRSLAAARPPPSRRRIAERALLTKAWASSAEPHTRSAARDLVTGHELAGEGLRPLDLRRPARAEDREARRTNSSRSEHHRQLGPPREVGLDRLREVGHLHDVGASIGRSRRPPPSGVPGRSRARSRGLWRIFQASACSRPRCRRSGSS